VWQCQISGGANIDLSALTTTVHIGAHADAPSHYHREGIDIARVSLEAYVGPCVVIDACGQSILRAEWIEQHCPSRCQRVLFKTRDRPQESVFETKFCFFEAAAIELLAQRGCLLVGIDTPSVDEFSSKDLPAHQALFRHQMRNLEGLELSHVESGAYELLALPLRLSGFDASPVRAVLRCL
jgi:arylformamidase